MGLAYGSSSILTERPEFTVDVSDRSLPGISAADDRHVDRLGPRSNSSSLLNTYYLRIVSLSSGEAKLRAIVLGVVVFCLSPGVLPTASAQEHRSCSDTELTDQIENLSKERAPYNFGKYILIFEDIQPTTEIRSGQHGIALLSCKANVILSTGAYNNIIFGVDEFHGELYYGYSMRPGKYPAAMAFAPPPVPPVPGSSPLAMYARGLADRATWESWFATLWGDRLSGAEYWAEQRSTPQPGPCRNASGLFQSGCNEAKQRLDPSDVLRKSDRDYYRGWNAYAPPR